MKNSKLQSFNFEMFEKSMPAEKLTDHNNLLKKTMAKTKPQTSKDLKRIEAIDRSLLTKQISETVKDLDDQTNEPTPELIILNSPQLQKTVQIDSDIEPKLENLASSKVCDKVFDTGLVDQLKTVDDGDFSDKSWKTMKYTLIVLGLSCALSLSYVLHLFGGPKRDDEGVEIMDEFSSMPLLEQYYYRTKKECNQYKKMIKEPSRLKLLPDILQPPYFQPPYTLVVEFTDVLVHPEWTYNTGWRFKKRPGVDKFLELLYTRFELVVYTAELGMTVFPILEALDVNNYITYKLVRDATNFVDGHHVKDLDKLNRDLSKVIVVDWNPASNNLHTENLFKIPKWDGKDDDTTLYDLTAFLVAISEWEVDDVRAVLDYYSQFDSPLEKFKQRQMQILGETN